MVSEQWEKVGLEVYIDFGMLREGEQIGNEEHEYVSGMECDEHSFFETMERYSEREKCFIASQNSSIASLHTILHYERRSRSRNHTRCIM